MPDAEPWEGIRDAIIDSVKSHVASFLDSNKEARSFLKEKAERMARLAWQYRVTENLSAKEDIAKSMEIVSQTMENTLTTIALNAAIEGRAVFATVVRSVFGAVVKLLPTLL